MRKLKGKVVSVKMNNTIVVEVARQIVHPLYKKIMRRTTRVKAHNEDKTVKTGDSVEILSVRPISKDKHYKVVGIVK